MTRTYLQGYDIDPDDMAHALRRLADGIERGGVAVKQAKTTHDVDADDVSTFGVNLRYHATHDFDDVVDVIRYAAKAYLRFDDEYIGPLLSGDKSVTVRYELEREFEVGSPISLIDGDGDTFATATVEAVLDMPVGRVFDFGIGRYESTDALIDTLRRLYGDDSIDDGTYVTVVLLGDTEPTDDYPTDQYTNPENE